MLVSSDATASDVDRYLISINELLAHGCPNCGCCKGYRFVTAGNTTLWVCHKCGKECYAQSDDGWCPIPIDMGKVIDAVDKHPRRLLPCIGCSSCAEDVVLIETGRFVTPGCFVSGGDMGEHDALVIQTSCSFAAQKIVNMFEAGAAVDGEDRVIIGSKQENRTKLNSLMLHIIRHERIDAHTILQAQRNGLRNEYHA